MKKMIRIPSFQKTFNLSAVCLAFAILPVSGLMADDSRESGNQTNSNWSIQYGFGYGNPSVQNVGWFGNPNASAASSLLFSGGGTIDPLTLYLASKPTPAPKGESFGSRFYAEYAPNIVGFVFGMSSDVMQLTFPQDNLSTILILQKLASGAPLDTYTTSTLLNPPPQKQGLNVTTLDFGINFHMNARKTVDPYFMLGLGVGGCAHDCYAGKVFARLGVKFNFGGGYAFLESEYNNYWLKYTEIQDALQLNGPKGTLGFGLYL